ncbi:hypothetical protein [Streptomyces sp. NPDC102437]|uniref:hypothetical protein n=1 Tax=Streptomyces sp. NPDC102437 TaxID=3366175 RepID=UPI003812D66D
MAWQGAFDACLSAAGGQRAFDPVADCLHHVDGRSRLDGAAGFLASRGLDLPLGDPGDAPGTATVWAVAARKEELLTASVRAHGVAASPGTVRLLHALGRERVACAAVSASRHATELMAGEDTVSQIERPVRLHHTCAPAGRSGRPRGRSPRHRLSRRRPSPAGGAVRCCESGERSSASDRCPPSALRVNSRHVPAG